MELVKKLAQREENGEPIQVGIVGCGQMGSGLAHTIHNVSGMTVSAIADIEPDRGIETFLEMGYSRDDIAVAEHPGFADDLVNSGKKVVTQDALLLPRIDSLEANVEVTGIPDIGAAVAIDSIMAGKPIIVLNVETDITIGLYLSNLARKMGTVYTVASGDEPGVCKMLYEQATLMGFNVVCLGKGKNNTIDFEATPESCTEEAFSKDMNPKILSSFKDGTKTMVEMAAVSNATGLLPDVPGMHGPKIELEGLASTFIPERDGGIFSEKAAVDFSTGKIAPGVFAVVHSDDKRIRKDMKFITKADGPYYLHFRPYHLCDLETPQSVAEAVLLGEVTVTAEDMNSEVVCVAKRDLKAGMTVDGIGGCDWFGRIYTYKQACEFRAIPIGIAAGGKVKKNVRKGELLSEESFEPDSSTMVYRIRKMQESLISLSGRNQL